MTNNLEKEIKWLLEEKYNGRRTPAAEKDIKRLEQGEPITYVIGFVDFLGCRIDLSKRPFIPRPETEYWAEAAVKDINTSGMDQIHCLDIFAGSGCVGVSVLRYVPEATIDFVEKNERFCEQIHINTDTNKINPERYRIIRSDLFSEVNGTYDYIFANPPYIGELCKDTVQKSVLDWEPHEAFFAGDDGLSVIRPFLKEAAGYLNSSGKLYMEISTQLKAKIKNMFEDFGYDDYTFYRDQFGEWRYVIAKVIDSCIGRGDNRKKELNI